MLAVRDRPAEQGGLACDAPRFCASSPGIHVKTHKNNTTRYLGLVENVRVRRAGFCFRESYAEFFRRYALLSKACIAGKWKDDDKSGCKRIMDDIRINPAGYQMGKTKLFIKTPQDVFRLEEERDEALDKIVVPIQRGFRKHRAQMLVPNLAGTPRSLAGWGFAI